MALPKERGQQTPLLDSSLEVIHEGRAWRVIKNPMVQCSGGIVTFGAGAVVAFTPGGHYTIGVTMLGIGAFWSLGALLSPLFIPYCKEDHETQSC